jgi:hypothetical protein
MDGSSVGGDKGAEFSTRLIEIESLIKKQNGRCQYCGGSINTSNSHFKRQKTKVSIQSDPLSGALKQWRLDKSREEKVPAYIIIHDRSIEALVNNRPSSLPALLKIYGIGPSKVDRYGEEILKIITIFPDISIDNDPLMKNDSYCICTQCTSMDRLSIALPRGQINRIKESKNPISKEIRTALSVMTGNPSGGPPNPNFLGISGFEDDHCLKCGNRIAERCPDCGNSISNDFLSTSEDDYRARIEQLESHIQILETTQDE